MNNWENLTTKQKIVKTTMDIIAEEGFHNITIRKIAARANVNLAAVNYHFGSKDGVIDTALATVNSEIRKTFAVLHSDQTDAATRLLAFINQYTEIINKYPDLIKKMIDHAIHNKPLDKHAEYMTFLKVEGIASIKQVLSEIKPEADENALYMRTLYLLSALSFPILMGSYITEMMGVDLKDETVRHAYIQLLLESVLL